MKLVFDSEMMTEWEIHQAVVNRLEHAELVEPGFVFWHTPNSTYTQSWNQKRKLSRAGVRAGVPDLFLVRPPIAQHAIWTPPTLGPRFYAWELKAKKGKLSNSQERWMKYFASVGIFTAVTYGWEEAEKQMEEWKIP